MKDTETPQENDKEREKRHAASNSAETKKQLAQLGAYLDMRFGSLEAAYDYMQSLFSSGRVGMVAFEEVLVAQVHFCTRAEVRTLFHAINGGGPTGYLTKEKFCSAFTAENRSASTVSRPSQASSTGASHTKYPAVFRPHEFLHPTPQPKARHTRKSNWGQDENGNWTFRAASASKAGSEETSVPIGKGVHGRSFSVPRTAGYMPKVLTTRNACTASGANNDHALAMHELVMVDTSQRNVADALRARQKSEDTYDKQDRASTDEKDPGAVERVIASPVFTLTKSVERKTTFPHCARAQSNSPPRCVSSNAVGTTVYFSMCNDTPPMCFFSPSAHAMSRQSSLFWDSPDDVITASYLNRGPMVFSIDGESSLSPRSARATSTYAKTRLSFGSSWSGDTSGVISPVSARSAHSRPIFPRITNLIAETEHAVVYPLSNNNTSIAVREHNGSRKAAHFIISSPVTFDSGMTPQDVPVSQALSNSFTDSSPDQSYPATKAALTGTTEEALVSSDRAYSLHDTPSSSNSANCAPKDNAALLSSPTSQEETRDNAVVEPPLNPIITPIALPESPIYDRPCRGSDNLIPPQFPNLQLPTRLTPPSPSISSFIPDDLSDCLDDELDGPPSRSSDTVLPTTWTPSQIPFTWDEGEKKHDASQKKRLLDESLMFRCMDCSSDELSILGTSTQSRVTYVEDDWTVLKDAPCTAAQRVCDLSVLQSGGHTGGSETCVAVPRCVYEDSHARSITDTGDIDDEHTDVSSVRSRYVEHGMLTSLEEPAAASPRVNTESARCRAQPRSHNCATGTAMSGNAGTAAVQTRLRIPGMAYTETIVRGREHELPNRSIHIPLPAFQNPMQLRMYLHKKGHDATMHSDDPSLARLSRSELPFNLVLFVQSNMKSIVAFSKASCVWRSLLLYFVHSLRSGMATSAFVRLVKTYNLLLRIMRVVLQHPKMHKWYFKCKTMLTMLDQSGLELTTMTASGQCSRQYASVHAGLAR